MVSFVGHSFRVDYELDFAGCISVKHAPMPSVLGLPEITRWVGVLAG